MQSSISNAGNKVSGFHRVPREHMVYCCHLWFFPHILFCSTGDFFPKHMHILILRDDLSTKSLRPLSVMWESLLPLPKLKAVQKVWAQGVVASKIIFRSYLFNLISLIEKLLPVTDYKIFIWWLSVVKMSWVLWNRCELRQYSDLKIILDDQVWCSFDFKSIF